VAQLTAESNKHPDVRIDLKDERDVTKHCIRICEDARSYIESLTKRESSLLQEAAQDATGNHIQASFEAQLLTRQALGENQDSFARISEQLRKRLESLVGNENSENDNERLQLQQDIEISKQCLEVCNMASENTRQKIYRIGEVIADGESDQVVVTTLADLFDIKKALSKNNSAQLIGSMSEESLRHLTDKRYDSRFGALVSTSDLSNVSVASPHVVAGASKSKQDFSPQTESSGQSPRTTKKQTKPSPNEMRKRVTGDGSD
jgi:hypothetical protein